MHCHAPPNQFSGREFILEIPVQLDMNGHAGQNRSQLIDLKYRIVALLRTVVRCRHTVPLAWNRRVPRPSLLEPILAVTDRQSEGSNRLTRIRHPKHRSKHAESLKKSQTLRRRLHARSLQYDTNALVPSSGRVNNAPDSTIARPTFAGISMWSSGFTWGTAVSCTLPGTVAERLRPPRVSSRFNHASFMAPARMSETVAAHKSSACDWRPHSHAARSDRTQHK